MEAEYRQIISFLKELDKKVNKLAAIYLIGGGAITLAYDRQNRTSDLDVIDPPDEITKIGGTKSDLALKYKVGISPLSEITLSAPADWKDKCHLIDLGFKNLMIYVADIHDLILGKIARLEPRDIQDINSLISHPNFNLNKLVERLNENKNEFLNNLTYKNNVKLLFELVFGLKLIFREGQAKLSAKSFSE